MAAKLFISYSHEDEVYKDQLLTHLTMLKREGLIEPWSDRAIMAGEDFSAAIDGELAKADIILLLVSANFIQSAYCYSREMTRAMELHRGGRAHVVPVIVRPCDWQKSPFGTLNATPRGGKAITTWRNDDEAYLDVVQAIRRIVEKSEDVSAPDAAQRTVRKTGTRLPLRIAAGAAALCVAGGAVYWQRGNGNAPSAAQPLAALPAATAPPPASTGLSAVNWPRTGEAAVHAGATDTDSPPLQRKEAAAPLPLKSTGSRANHGSITVSEGVVVIAEIAVAAAPGEAWDPGTKALSQLPDVFVCFRQAPAGRETCQPTLGGIANARTKAHGNTSHVADVYTGMKVWNATFWVELKNQDWRDAKSMGKAECRFGEPCVVASSRDGKTTIAEVIVLPALASAGEPRVRFLDTCADTEGLLFQQARALLAAAGVIDEGRPLVRLSHDMLARTFLAAVRSELSSALLETALQAAQAKGQSATAVNAFRGTILNAAAAETGSGGQPEETKRALAELRRDVEKAGIAGLLEGGCG